MNLRLLRQVRQDILDKPTQFQMPSWAEPRYDKKGELCGAACCIAGDALLRKGATLKPTEFGGLMFVASKKSLRDKLSPAAFEDPRWACFEHELYPLRAGAELLDLTTEEAVRLFDMNYWPEKFATAYREAKTARGRARAAARRIDHFIETDGTDGAIGIYISS